MPDPSAVRSALITGVSRPLGLGFAVARQLAEESHQVVLAARDETRAERLAAELRQAGHRASAMRLDLSDQSSIDQAAGRLARMLDRLDVLVNNASAMPDFGTRSPLDVRPGALRAKFDVNVIGCWSLIQALLPLLLRSPSARIVNVTSAAAWRIGARDPGPLRSPAYALARHALNALTVTLAAALADTPVLVNVVDPGAIASHPERGDDADDRSPVEAAQGVVRAATLGAGGPSGGFFRDGAPIAATAP